MPFGQIDMNEGGGGGNWSPASLSTWKHCEFLAQWQWNQIRYMTKFVHIITYPSSTFFFLTIQPSKKVSLGNRRTRTRNHAHDFFLNSSVHATLF